VKLAEIVDELDLKVRTAGGALEREVSGGYASDLLSDVIAHATTDCLWVTLQIHQNIVAVASLKELAGAGGEREHPDHGVASAGLRRGRQTLRDRNHRMYGLRAGCRETLGGRANGSFSSLLG